jgi:predicted nucleic acid-binding protein
MHKTIISDISCFIVLSNINELDLLQKLYGQITTTVEIVTEYGEALPEWVTIENVKDTHRQELLEMHPDTAEASVLALALETPDSTIITDDYHVRKIAEKLKLNYTGTIGVIIRAKLKGIIPLIRPLLAKIKQADFRLGDDAEQQALKEAGE